MMDYWELRKAVAAVIPRRTQLDSRRRHVGAVKEKGRKKNYHQFDLQTNEWKKQERLLDTETVNSFVEVSCRAAACPMPLNLDVWDGLVCPFRCRYCFANAFRASLYTAFFDNSRTMGFRHCKPDHYKPELDKLLENWGEDPHGLNGDVKRAVALGIPMRLGIRFEDFLAEEAKAGISLELLRHLSQHNYPVMINTKSALVGEDRYVEALSSNEGGAAVHVTMISSDQSLLDKLEPGAPPFSERLAACKKLVLAGVKVVARIEPFLVFVNDEREAVYDYIEQISAAGIENITFDTYSYTAHNPGIRQAFVNEGIDFERLFLLGCDSQAIGSLLLDSFMDVFRNEGFSCSTFDIGCAPSNDQIICCEVGNFFGDRGAGFSWGCSVGAARFIVDRGKAPSRWSDFEEWVLSKGGWLSDTLRTEVHQLWNVQGNEAYAPNWARGILPYGADEDGIVWKFEGLSDFRRDILKGLI
jgi:hypothetical protein